jgi:hypothetical protein
MGRGQRISPRASISRYAAPSHDPRNLPDLLILHDIISRRINTYKTLKNSRIAFIPKDFKPTRINTSGAKDLKSPRINTSGNKDLKSFRISTSKKYPPGRFAPQNLSLLRRIELHESTPLRAVSLPPANNSNIGAGRKLEGRLIFLFPGWLDGLSSQRPMSCTWATSSAGRAPRSQRGGRGFKSPVVHQSLLAGCCRMLPTEESFT